MVISFFLLNYLEGISGSLGNSKRVNGFNNFFLNNDVLPLVATSGSKNHNKDERNSTKNFLHSACRFF